MSMDNVRWVVLIAGAAVCLLASSCTWVTQATVGWDGSAADGDSFDARLSFDGRFTVFASEAENLVEADSNGVKDIFVRDNQTGSTELISRSMGGGSANGLSGQPNITPNGRWIVYWSFGSDIVPGDTNGRSDVFRYDRQTETTVRVSVGTGGTQGSEGSLGGSITSNGDHVVFYTLSEFDEDDTNGSHDVYEHEVSTATTTLVSQTLTDGPTGQSYDPIISDNGNHVVFSSTAPAFAGPGGVSQVVLQAVYNSYPTVLTDGRGGVPAANGPSYAVDVADDSPLDLVPIVLMSTSADNLDPADTNGVADAYLLYASNLDAEIRQLESGDAATYPGSMSRDGDELVVGYSSAASNLQAAGDGPLDTNGLIDAYVWRGSATSLEGSSTLASDTGNDGLADGAVNYAVDVSPNGEAVAFASAATNLGFAADTNGALDVYVRPAVEPHVTAVVGAPIAGTTTVVTLQGSFNQRPEATLLGDGDPSVHVSTFSPTSVSMLVTLDASATPGPRTLWVAETAPHLGLDTLGGGDTVVVDVQPPA